MQRRARYHRESAMLSVRLEQYEEKLNGDRERKVLNGHERKGERRLARRAPFIEIWNQWFELRNGNAVQPLEFGGVSK